jgi:succinate dehydrogenase / fumarate reductase, cytochrome b subunit
MANFFTSSIGKKIIMAAAGLFLVLFLLVHLGINSLLIIFEDTDNFNIAAHFMGTNIVIKVFEIVLFGGFLLHIIYGLILQVQNWLSRPKAYKVTNYSQTSFFSKFMIHTAIIIFVFLAIHLSDFYFKAKFFGEVPDVMIDGKEYHDLGSLVIAKFQIPGFVIFYIASFLFLGFHLLHGFQSGFKTLGLENSKYTSAINITGIVYTLIVTAGFTAIPIVIYFIR